MAGSSSPCGTCSLRGQQLFARLPTYQQVGVVELGMTFTLKGCTEKPCRAVLTLRCTGRAGVRSVQAQSLVLAVCLPTRHTAVPCRHTSDGRQKKCGRHVSGVAGFLTVCLCGTEHKQAEITSGGP